MPAFATPDYAENHRFASFFTLFAALSQGVGGALVVLAAKEGFDRTSAHMMSFSAGVMLYLSFLDIMVQAIEKIGTFHANTAFFIGIALFLILENFVPEADVASILGTGWQEAEEKDSKKEAKPSAREDHVSSNLRQRKPAQDDDKKDSQSRRSRRPSSEREEFSERGEKGRTVKQQNAVAFAGAMAMITISLHNLPEGIAVYLTCLKGVESGLPLAVAMALHNIPEGMAVAGPIYAATKSRKKAAAFATFSGASPWRRQVLTCAHLSPRAMLMLF